MVQLGWYSQERGKVCFMDFDNILNLVFKRGLLFFFDRCKLQTLHRIFPGHTL